MKRLLSIFVTGTLALVLLLPHPSSAAGIKKGLKLGVNYATLSGENMGDLDAYIGQDTKSKLAFCLGGYVTYKLNETFTIQPEVLYTMKGSTFRDEVGGEVLKVWINLTYLEIPVLARITIPSLGTFNPVLLAGPAFAIKLSGKLKTELEGVTTEVNVEDMKGIDIGFIIGAGMDLGVEAFGLGKLALDLRYTLGLSAISEFANDDAKNRALSLMVGISF